MPKKSGYVYSDLSGSAVLTVVINGLPYECVQFSCSYAVNEVPTAIAMLALGRNARTLQEATVHFQADRYQMQPATVEFNPTQEYSPKSNWPKERQVIFRGYFTGFSYRKINGKVHAIASFIHWLAALGFSSSLTKNGHVSNPTALNAAAVLQSLGTTGSAKGVNISYMTPGQIISQNVGTDLWKAIKQIFCSLATTDTMPVGLIGECGGFGDFSKNDFALKALDFMEGPADDCSTPYKWGVPLALDTLGVYSLEDAIAWGIGRETIDSYASVTFWDKLVGQFCPMFGMAVVPMSESAIVIADTPALGNNTFWVEIDIDEYDSFDMSSELFRPLRGVGVVASYVSQTQAGIEEAGNQLPIIGGCYLEDSVNPGDGMIQYIAPPSWLSALQYQSNYAQYTTGLLSSAASKVATSAFAGITTPIPTPDSLGLNGNLLYQRYAQDYYVNSMLRGRSGSISGKLRFDIAPGSIIKISPSQEVFLGGEDTLAFPIYACVQRVSITINAESAIAGTSFSLSHMRTQAENSVPRTSVSAHPLFGKSIHGNGKHGSPLVDAYKLE